LQSFAEQEPALCLSTTLKVTKNAGNCRELKAAELKIAASASHRTSTTVFWSNPYIVVKEPPKLTNRRQYLDDAISVTEETSTAMDKQASSE
jgi:recombinational DNA repair ATPase RecF